MKKIIALVFVFVFSMTAALAEGFLLPSRNNKMAEVIVIEDGSPRSTERGRILKDGDGTKTIISTERLNKKPTLIRIKTLPQVMIEAISVIPGREDPNFTEDCEYLQACLRYFDRSGHYMQNLDGYSLEDATLAGAEYVSLAKFFSKVVATEVAKVAFAGGANVVIGFTTTLIPVEALDGTKVMVEKRHYAIVEGKPVGDKKPSKPTVRPTKKPEDTDWTIGNTPTPTPAPTPTPEDTGWTIGSTPTPKPEDTGWTIGSTPKPDDTGWTIGGNPSNKDDTDWSIGNGGSSSTSSGSTSFTIGGSGSTDETSFTIGGESNDTPSSSVPTADEDTGFTI